MEELGELFEIVKENNRDAYQRIIEEKADYRYLYHLSEARENLVSSLLLEKGMRVLELHAECGALTGKLLEMTGDVTAVTKTEQEAQIIRERCKGSQGLWVCTGEDFAQACDQKFDVIFIAGRTYEIAGQFLILKKLLAEGGRIFLADANRFGLKYFAGCKEEYAGEYFAGVEGYPDERTERCYSKREYEEFFEKNGFEILQWFYPYPDHKFPSVLYSDNCQPERGELADNRRNFDGDRYELFEEKRVFDGLVSEGLFPEFSNSFLIEACALGEQMNRTRKRELYYTKYSSERAKNFAIRTDVVKTEEGEIAVYKRCLYPEGERHIDHMKEAYDQLSEKYANSKIVFCKCEREENAARFPFVRGMTLQEVMEEAVHRRNHGRVREILTDYISRVLEEGGSVPFRVTEGFVKVFGEVSLPEDTKAAEVCDIDLIFSNILVSASEIQSGRKPGEYHWGIIDYEWTFLFPVPKQFMIYRALYFTYYQILNDTEWTLPQLMELAGIDEAMQQAFMEMERQFQRYLGKDALPVRNMQRLMGTKIMSLGSPQQEFGDGELWFREEEWMKVRRIQFHIDRQDYQDGTVVCSGWALARVKDGRTLPVHLHVTDGDGKRMPVEIHRNERWDVVETLKIHQVTKPEFGFDCVWVAPPGKNWNLHFTLGKYEAVYETAAL